MTEYFLSVISTVLGAACLFALGYVAGKDSKEISFEGEVQKIEDVTEAMEKRYD